MSKNRHVRSCRLSVLGLLPLIMVMGLPARADINVVVTIKPIHALVAGVIGDLAKPGILIQGAGSPHTFAMKPSDAVALNKADLFIRVSDELEPFTKKLVTSLPKSVAVMTLADIKGLTLLPIRTGGAFEDHDHGKPAKGHSHGHSHAHGPKKGQAVEMDGHIWLDPSNAKLIVAAVADRLGALRPQHAATFKSNATALQKRLDELDDALARQLASAKGQPFIAFHDAYQYFERRYGLNAVGSFTVNPEVQPSGKRLSALRQKVQSLKAVCVLSEPQFSTKLVSAVTDGVAVRTGVMDPLGAGIEPGPDLYFGVMHGLAKSIEACAAAPS